MKIEIPFVYGRIDQTSSAFATDRTFFFCILFLILCRLWLVDAFHVLATWTPHDDYLFISLAKNILSGKWLGQYSQMTLIKGPGYPLFIAFAHLLSIPTLLAQQILYSIACLVAITSLRPFCTNRYILLICFFLLLFNPFLYNYPVPGRIFREGFSITLVLFVFSSMCGLLSRLHSSHQYIVWSFGLGCAFTLLWHTREEGIWMLPALCLFALCVLLSSAHIPLKRKIFSLLIPLMVFGILTAVLFLKNHHYYGRYITNELKSKEFVSAYGGLMNIKPASFMRFVPVQESQMEKAFAVSPSFAELKPFFDEAKTKAHLVPTFYIWSLREIVKQAGHAGNLDEALRFYGKIGDELASACTEGKIDCLSRKPSLQPPWHASYNKLVLPVFWDILQQAISFEGFHLDVKRFLKSKSNGSNRVINDFQFITLSTIEPSAGQFKIVIPDFYQHLRIEKVRILQDIGNSYKVLAPVLFILVLIFHLFLFAMDIKKKMFSGEVLFGAVLLGGLAALVAVLTFVKITLWPIHRPLYSGYSLVLYYICFGLILGHAYCRRRKMSVKQTT